MFVITVIFFPELFALFWLILTPIRKGSIVFKGLLHLHYILCGSHSKAIKKNIQFSLLRSSFHYTLHKWAVKQVFFFPTDDHFSFQSEYLSTFFFTFILWVKRSSSSRRVYLMAAFHKKITFFLLGMTSNLSRGISDLHKFFFKAFPYSYTDICRVYYFWRSYLAILSRLHQFERAWFFFFLHMETQEKICPSVAFSKRLNQL